MNKDLTGLRYTIKAKEFKKMGYEFLSHDGNRYILEIEKWVCTIWIFVAGKTVHVNDWYDRTYDIIEFYKANKNDKRFLNEDSIRIMFDYVSGDIIINTKYEEIDNAMKKFFGQGRALKDLIKKYEKYKRYREVDLNKKNMNKLIKELEKLKPIQEYAGTPV